MPLIIFLAVAAITIVSVLAIERAEAAKIDSELREKSRAIASALERKSSANSAYLRAGAALFSSSETVTEPVFRRFVEQLQIESGYRGADGIGWATRIDGPNGEDVARVTYFLPDTDAVQNSSGYDLTSDPIRRAAMEEAARTARPTASAKLTLESGAQDQHSGFVVFMPAYRSGADGQLVKGFIYSPFNTQLFLDSAIEREGLGQFGVRLFDTDVSDEDVLARVAPAYSTGKTQVEEVSIANRQLILEVESARSDTLSSLSMVTLLFGMLVASLLMGIARMVSKQAREDAEALEQLEAQASIRNSLTRELNHRVKNTLANILSIVSLTRRRSSDVDDFADSLDGRIRAISATHDLLTQSEWGTTPIRSVIEAELGTQLLASDTQIDLQGDELMLAPNNALTLGLALHELATNAAKFGALSVPGGTVSVSWRMIKDGLARLDWQESGGPTVASERQRGFGVDLIEKVVASELKSPVELKFEEQGVQCSMHVPIRPSQSFEIRSAQTA